MRNVTLSAEAEWIDQARRRAEAENTTLNQAFRDWLKEYAGGQRLTLEDVRQAAETARHFRVGRPIGRDERNSR